MITSSYFIGHPMGVPTSVYVVPFTVSNEGDIVFFGNAEWIRETYPYGKYFMQLMAQQPALMHEGDIFIAKKDADWDISWKLDDVMFIKDDNEMPLQNLVTIALNRIKDENYLVANMQLFRPGDTQHSQQQETQNAQSAMLMLMAFDQFNNKHFYTTLVIHVNFHHSQSSGYQVFQEAKIPFLGIK